jgi:hypothetical protein
MCESVCLPRWSPDGKFLYLAFEPATRTSPGQTLAIPIGLDESIPDLPSTGIPLRAQTSLVNGSESVPRENVIPGRDPFHAYVNTAVHRNLYRISIP